MFAALRHQDFRLLWAATFASNAGSWMQKVSTAWLIYQMTGSKAWLGTDAFASGITTVLLLPIGGVIADRIDRRLLLIVTNTLCALFSFGLAAVAAAGSLHVWHIIAFSALSGIVQAVMVPASTSLLPALVGADDVPNAIALNSLQFNLSRAVGPILGGAVLARFGATPTFALNAMSFLVLVAAFFFIRSVPPVPATKLSMGQSLAEGVRYVRTQAELIKLLVLVAVTATLGAPVISLLPALTTDVLHRRAESYSFLVTCFGIGAMIAAVGATLLGKRLARASVIGALVATVGLAQLVAAHSDWSFATVLVGLAGMAFVGTMIQLGTSILQKADDAYRGRVTSLQQICFRVGQPLGALAGGLLADRIGIGAVFSVFGGVLIAAGFTTLIASNRSSPSERYPSESR